MKLGLIAIARPTFDVSFAADTARVAVENLTHAGHEITGDPNLAMDEDAITAVRTIIDGVPLDAVIVLQASFADSLLAVAATEGVNIPIVLWAFPEERTGGRLRLNSFCGINLAGYTLTRMGRSYRWIYRDAADPVAPEMLVEAIRADVEPSSAGLVPSIEDFSDNVMVEARRVRVRLDTTVIGRIGERPDGFEPCDFEVGALRAILGVRVDEVPLPELFVRAADASDSAVRAVLERSASFLSGIDGVDQIDLEHSLRLNVGLKSLIDEKKWDGVATRCWPETFTDFGGAACTPMALLSDNGTPGSCEADIYGNITGLVLQWLGESASFVADLVHLDPGTNTGVFWHCGLAPFEMADPSVMPVATVHSNRKKPLLSEFPLKPGLVTLARFSQSRGIHRLVIGRGEMVHAPLAFSGTAGVLRFESPIAEVEETILTEGLEHHYGIVYADVADELRALAGLLEIPVVEL